RRLAARHDLDLCESYAYGNCLADLPMLDAVGHPVAVNPEVGLERIACSEGESGNRAGASRDGRVCTWKTTEPSRHQRVASVVRGTR
ncbi:MAG: hypothetical protein WA581_19475, partial [Candidatus Acidiferrales bacterium]